MINHGLSTGALFLLVGVVYERRHTRQLSDYGGLVKVMPWFAVIFMIMTLSSIGMPLIPGNGFTGEWTILVGVFGLATKAWAILGATGLVLGATYMLWLYQRTMFGKLDNEENRNLTDLTVREFAYLVPLVALAFWIGIRPEPFFRVLDEPVQRLVQQVEKTYEFPRGLAGLPPRLGPPVGAERTMAALPPAR
jgi:NADH-quinone oxidoreductase subunit M